MCRLIVGNCMPNFNDIVQKGGKGCVCVCGGGGG